MAQTVIDFNRCCLTGNELTYVQASVANRHISGSGPFGRKCEQLLESILGAPRVLLTTSCTHALEMSADLLNISDGDEIIVPSFTFVSTANAFVLRGAVPRFCDIRRDTLNLDEHHAASLITEKTRAIVPVHYAGVACNMPALLELAVRNGISIVEDNAHGLFASLNGQPLGTYGRLATQSFHETKNVTCGEGGALVINDASLVDRAEMIREKGTDRSRFHRGLVDKYTWRDIGSSYVQSDLLAAFLYAQLEKRHTIQSRRQAIWSLYEHLMRELARDFPVQLPIVPGECRQAFHMFYLLVETEGVRTALLNHLKSCGITAVFHYLPLHLSPMAARFGGRPGLCPVSEDISSRIIRLPLYCDLEDREVECVAAAVRNFFESRSSHSSSLRCASA